MGKSASWGLLTSIWCIHGISVKASDFSILKPGVSSSPRCFHDSFKYSCSKLEPQFMIVLRSGSMGFYRAIKFSEVVHVLSNRVFFFRFLQVSQNGEMPVLPRGVLPQILSKNHQGAGWAQWSWRRCCRPVRSVSSDCRSPWSVAWPGKKER